jgi:hypothetical protein
VLIVPPRARRLEDCFDLAETQSACTRVMTSNRAPETAPLTVREGRLLAYRLLDVADEIDLLAVARRRGRFRRR